ncbi:iron uptake transporter deferrochelatase/peroxidase subunit [Streptomyces odontomachi]|uniref:iron uptake transporter deferrochelatase/peroxidase subunit n=1 Tax=Streptomyces odontomachi TaxID=2944940 RepID=UPI002108F217|nr:iron uptake transporter deferrochelatase/peroxidase subunit [Streptomyces sp. ODS25]
MADPAHPNDPKPRPPAGPEEEPPAGPGPGSSVLASPLDDSGEGSGDGSGDGSVSGNPGASRLSRRQLLGTAGGAGLVLGAAGGFAAAASGSGNDGAAAGKDGSGSANQDESLASVGLQTVMFHGKHQAGITDSLQAHGYLVAFDLRPGAGRKQAAALLRRWTATTDRLMAGKPVDVAGHDTGVARDAGTCALSVTFGFGHGFFSRTGLDKQRPRALDPLPDFPSDRLDRSRSNGDLWIQIGANDSLVAFHALRALQKEAAGTARIRWQMGGFNRAPGATTEPKTPRNLMGQLDGTNNPKPSDDDFEGRIFVPSDGSNGDPDWMAGGSYVVVRRIRMLLDDWEKLTVTAQEKVIGRRKSTGAPLTGGTEHTEMKLDATGPDGKPVIPLNAHARITRPDQNGGAAMLRRPFSFHDGFDQDGVPDAGLLFICWQADPLRGFVPVQRKLDRGDALSPFIRHEASGLFAVPAWGDGEEYLGQRLLEA